MASNITAATLSDTLPRAVLIVAIFISAYMVTSAIRDHDHNNWITTLNRQAATAANYLVTEFNNARTTVAELSMDQRITDAFEQEAATDNRTLRRALFEFQYIHQPESTHVYRFADTAIIAQTTATDKLPISVINNLTRAAELNVANLTDLVLSASMPEVSFASLISSDTGIAEGYAIVTKKLFDLIEPTRRALDALGDVTVSLYYLGSGSDAIRFDQIQTSAPIPRIISDNNRTMPLFTTPFPTGIYTPYGGRSQLIAMARLPGFNKWAAAVALPLDHLGQASQTTRSLIWLFAAIIALIVLVIPYQKQGPISRKGQRMLAAFKTTKQTLRKQGKPASTLNTVKVVASDTLLSAAAHYGTADGRHGRMVNLLQQMAGKASSRPSSLARLKNRSKVKKSTTSGRRLVVDARMTSKGDFATLASTKKPSNKPKKPPTAAVVAYNIRTGMKNKQLKLQFQPIFDTQTKQPVMHETYMRILADNGDIIPPPQWLPIAKKENLFGLIDETVITMATERFLTGKNRTDMPLTFNISGDTFQKMGFIEQLIAAGDDRAQRIAGHIIFEIKSMEIMEDKTTMNFIRDCRKKGFRFSMDYFGGGSATIKAAKKLRFDFVKLDAFKLDINSSKDQKLIIGLATTAKEVGLPMIIERIEDQKLVTLCEKIGVPYIQGYHLQKPEDDLTTTPYSK